jgi:hypothetical protein
LVGGCTAQLAQQQRAIRCKILLPKLKFAVCALCAPSTRPPACLPADLVALLQASRLPLVQLLAGEMAGGERGAQQGPGDRKGSQTVGARFRDQLRDLVQRLDA